MRGKRVRDNETGRLYTVLRYRVDANNLSRPVAVDLQLDHDPSSVREIDARDFMHKERNALRRFHERPH